MLVYAVDSDFYELKKYESALNKKDTALRLFTNAVKAWQTCQDEVPDLVFVEYEACNYKPLIEKMYAKNPTTQFVLVVSGADFKPALLNMNLFDVLEKPLDEEKIKQTVFRLRHPILSKMAHRNQ